MKTASLVRTSILLIISSVLFYNLTIFLINLDYQLSKQLQRIAGLTVGVLLILPSSSYVVRKRRDSIVREWSEIMGGKL